MADWMKVFIDVRIELAKQNKKMPKNLKDYSTKELKNYLQQLRGE